MLMKKLICLAVLSLCILTGCSERGSEGKENMENEAPFQEPAEEPSETLAGNLPENSGKQPVSEPNIVLADWSEYFDGINGAAVLYDPSDKEYRIYNQELAQTRRSPCSTFKIVSSLIALENGILDPEASTREWSGSRHLGKNRDGQGGGNGCGCLVYGICGKWCRIFMRIDGPYCGL